MAYSCRKGVCVTCRSGLTKGNVKIAPFGSPKSAGQDILCCMAVPDGSVEIAPPWIEERRQPERARMSMLVHGIDFRSKDVAVLQLRLPIGRRIRFSAGQYVTVMIEGGDSRNYSIANPPHLNDMLELHVRRVAGGMFSDRVLSTLKPGAFLDIEMPFGLFTWSDDQSRPVVMLATGTGFAPLKSMIRDLLYCKASRPVHLFWGGDRYADIYDLALVESWAATLPWFQFTPVLANPCDDWEGARGFVQEAVQVLYGDLANHDIYACGNPVMIAHARAVLTEQCGLRHDAFHSDAFVFSGQV